MNFRLWYPQLDVYDTIRRMALMLSGWAATPPSIERFHILDFFMANPPLLHQTHMPAKVRAAFRDLSIPVPGDVFISYPSAPLLFHKMEMVQKHALRTLTGKGLIDRAAFSENRVRVLPTRQELVAVELGRAIDEYELAVSLFLAHDFAGIDEGDIDAFRRRTGLRRAV